MSEHPYMQILQVAAASLWLYAGYRLVSHVLSSDQNAPDKFAEGSRVRQRLEERGVNASEQLNKHEVALCADLVFADDVAVGFADVVGLESVKQALFDAIVLPIRHPERYASKLLASPKGVLLYGPPGNGKTLLATALAKESGAAFLNVSASTLLQKYYGESAKFAKAIFTLARKIAPCIVFIDELDLLFSGRDEQGYFASVKSVLLAEWDGLASGTTLNNRVIVIAATNSPQLLDQATHRRLARQIYLGPPGLEMRVAILKKVLEKEEVSNDLIAQLGSMTDKYCGSDLVELCKAAAAIRVRRLDDAQHSGKQTPAAFIQQDFLSAMKIVKFAGANMGTYK